MIRRIAGPSEGTAILGLPMTLEWRRLALSELLKTQEQSGLSLIDSEEIAAIHREWAADDPQ